MMSEFESRDFADWERLAQREVKGEAGGLLWSTPEGLPVKPLYTAADLEGIELLDLPPGFPPFTRGVRATMTTRVPAR